MAERAETGRFLAWAIAGLLWTVVLPILGVVEVVSWFL